VLCIAPGVPFGGYLLGGREGKRGGQLIEELVFNRFKYCTGRAPP